VINASVLGEIRDLDEQNQDRNHSHQSLLYAGALSDHFSTAGFQSAPEPEIFNTGHDHSTDTKVEFVSWPLDST
jgi:hypothetical protein